MTMFRPELPGVPHAPQVLSKKQREYCEEDAGHLMPKFMRDTRERLPKSTASARDAAAKIARDGARVDWLRHRSLLRVCAWLRLRGRRLDRDRSFRAGSGTCFLRAIAQNFRGNASADSQLAT